MVLRVVTVPGDKEGERHWAVCFIQPWTQPGSTWVCDEFEKGQRVYNEQQGYNDESTDGRMTLDAFIRHIKSRHPQEAASFPRP